MKIYLIPGLGADKRMYQSQLRVLPGAQVLEHLPPFKGQTLAQYAQRLAPAIDTSQPFTLIGTSLGGMLAQELAQYVKPQKIILIASVKGRNELPAFIRSMRYLNLHRLITGNMFKSVNNLAARRLDSRGDSPAADLIKAMIDDASPQFITWAINAVINWHPLPHTTNIIHIHGSNDTLFPVSLIKNPVIIKGGSHVMNITMSDEVNQALLTALRK